MKYIILVKVFIYQFQKIFSYVYINKFTKRGVDHITLLYSIFSTNFLIITLRIFFIHMQIILISHFWLLISKLFSKSATLKGFNIHFISIMEDFHAGW